MTRYDILALLFAAFLVFCAFPNALRNHREAQEDAAIARAVWGMGKR